jgi:pyruvate ferredoxin oxidoreductase alpha subunit
MAIVALTGNDAVGTAMKQLNPDVVAAFPITPSTELMHKFAEFHANGEVDTELVLVESEHSAMSACVGAAAAGARAMTATSSAGMALMWELLYVAASLRAPIVMPLVNRALSAPINIHNDHSDSMGARDTGWIQIFSENAQEAYDQVLLAPRIAEHPDVLLPIMVTLDGFILSHTLEPVDMLEDRQIQEFIGTYKPKHSLLDLENPVTFGPLDLQDYYIEHKRQQHEATLHARRVVPEVLKAFGELSGRHYHIFEEYWTEDAEIILVVLGSTAGTVRHTVEQMRKQGKKVGVLKLRMFRPFPGEELVRALSKAKVIGIMDKSDSFGADGGPVFSEISAAFGCSETLRGNGQPPLIADYIYGLGGRDVGESLVQEIVADLEGVLRNGRVATRKKYMGVRE